MGGMTESLRERCGDLGDEEGGVSEGAAAEGDAEDEEALRRRRASMRGVTVFDGRDN